MSGEQVKKPKPMPPRFSDYWKGNVVESVPIAPAVPKVVVAPSQPSENDDVANNLSTLSEAAALVSSSSEASPSLVASATCASAPASASAPTSNATLGTTTAVLQKVSRKVLKVAFSLKATQLYEKARVLKEAVMPEIVFVDESDDDQEENEPQANGAENDAQTTLQKDEPQDGQASITMSDDADDTIMSEMMSENEFVFDDQEKNDGSEADIEAVIDGSKDDRDDENSDERINCCGKRQLSLNIDKNFCYHCYTWISKGRVIRCSCQRCELSPSTLDREFDDCDSSEIEIEWLVCTMCSRSSHKNCCVSWYVEGEPFICYACAPPSRRSVLDKAKSSKPEPEPFACVARPKPKKSAKKVATKTEKKKADNVQVDVDQDDNIDDKEKKVEEKEAKKQQNDDEKWHQCQYCAIQVNSFANLRSHHKVRHSSSKLIAVRIEAPTDFLCQVCGKDLETNFKLSQHYYHQHMPTSTMPTSMTMQEDQGDQKQTIATRKKRSLAEQSAAVSAATTASTVANSANPPKDLPEAKQKRVRTEKEQRDYEALLAQYKHLLSNDVPSQEALKQYEAQCKEPRHEEKLCRDGAVEEEYGSISAFIDEKEAAAAQERVELEQERVELDNTQKKDAESIRACSGINDVVALDVLGAKISNIESLHYALTLMMPTKHERQITRWAMLLKNQEVDSVHDLRCLPSVDFETLCGIIGSSLMLSSALRALRARL
jgi:hypothetical protein